MNHLLRKIYFESEIESDIGLILMENFGERNYSNWLEEIGLLNFDPQELREFGYWRISSLEDPESKKLFTLNKEELILTFDGLVSSFENIKNYFDSSRKVNGVYREENELVLKREGNEIARRIRLFVKIIKKLVDHTDIFICAVSSLERHLQNLASSRPELLNDGLISIYLAKGKSEHSFEEDLLQNLKLENSTTLIDLLGQCGLVLEGYSKLKNIDSDRELIQLINQLDYCEDFNQFNPKFADIFDIVLNKSYDDRE